MYTYLKRIGIFGIMAEKILIVEDQVVVQMGLEILLEQSFDGLKVEFASNFASALEYLATELVDLIILDINIPGGENSKMIPKFRALQPEVKILIFTGLEHKIYAAHYLQAGADGFLSKIDDENQLLKIMSRMLSEGKYFQKEDIKDTLITDNFSELTSSEQRVMYLLIQGKFTKEIASDLNLKVSTISTYKSRIFEKLSVQNVIELIKKVEIGKNLN